MCAHSTSTDNSIREKMYFFLTLHTVFTPEVQKEDEQMSVNVSSMVICNVNSMKLIQH